MPLGREERGRRRRRRCEIFGPLRNRGDPFDVDQKHYLCAKALPVGVLSECATSLLQCCICITCPVATSSRPGSAVSIANG